MLIGVYLVFLLSSFCTIPMTFPNGFVFLIFVVWVINSFWSFKVKLFT